MCKWLYQDLKLDVRLVQLQGHHTLHKAAWAGHKDVCKWLQDEIGIDPLSNVVDKKGHTAVSSEPLYDNVSIFRLFVSI